MDTVLQLIGQIVIMFLLAGIGFILFRTGKITQEGSKTIGNMLIYIVLPAVIIKGFLVERTPERMLGLAVSAGLAAGALLICIIISRLMFRKDAIASFASSFSNPGFFGIPLIIAILGNESVFYIAAYVGFLNLLQFTYGKVLITGDKKSMNAVQVLKAPFLTAIVIGLILFFTRLPLPGLITKTLDHVAGLNTPLAMFTVGVYLAQTDVKAMFHKVSLYKVSLARMILIPLVVMLVMKLIPETWHACKLAILIAAACPVGSNIAVYAQLYDRDYRYAVETVIISTILSIVTIPAIVFVAEHFW